MPSKTLAALALALSLAACTTVQPSLDKQLAGKSKSEQHAILKSECRREARWLNRHDLRMLEICDKMAAEMK